MSFSRLSHKISIFILFSVLVLFLAPLSAWAGHYKVLHVFKSSQDGRNPHQNLVLDAAGNLYGTAQSGGKYGNGMVFKLVANQDGSWTESVLYEFTGGADGGQSVAALVFDGAGNLYGTTEIGGQYNAGVVFKLVPNADGTWTESVLHSFAGGTDGYTCWAPITFDTAGNIFGATPWGGSNGDGVIFELTPNTDGSWTETVIHTFTGTDGADPSRALIFDAEGNLFGTGSSGGAYGNGVVFKLTSSPDGTWTETVLHSFNGKDGATPFTQLTPGSGGILYGTTYSGGKYGRGVVFSLTPQPEGTWVETVLHHFTGGNDGGNPWVGLAIDPVGNLYGTTGQGGAYR
jgi:uncharacterized repeat protein (TIGR03803 family)